MFRKLLLSTALVAAAGSAFAADLPYRTAAPAPYVAAPIFTWTGFYVGLNAGAGFNNKNNGYVTNGFGATTVFTTTGGGFGSNNDAGFTGGAQAGYNMQFGMFVAGVEGDINYLDRGNDERFIVSDNFGRTYTFNRGNSNNWFGTARGRVGIALDRFLPYVTGGWAFGGKQGGVNGSFVTTGVAGSTVLVNNGGSGSSSGWTLGGGLEYAFSNNMSVKIEYLHVKLGNNNSQFAVNTTGGVFSFKNENKFDVVRAGVNFRF
jgi:outer membrane immunogenic protein